MSNHPSDPSECVDALGDRCAPQDCVVEHSAGQLEHLIMDREQRRLELLVLEANARHHESQTEVSAERPALEINGVGTGSVLRERVTALASYHGSITHLQADIDQALADYGDPAEIAEPYPLDEAGALRRSEEDERRGAGLPVWIERTMADVRRGDRIRMPGQAGTEMDVRDRYWPPSEMPYRNGDTGTWHVVAGEKHWDDHVVQPGECCVVLGDDPRPRFFPPTMPVEIELTAAELAVIESFGWTDRMELKK